MAAPTSPYVTSEQVSIFVKNVVFKSTDFNSSTTLSKENVEQFIVWVGSQIDCKFSEAGFVIPFQTLSNETWPTHQTNYIELLTCLGVVTMIPAAMKPAPGVGPGAKGSAGNVWQEMFNKELDRVYDGTRSRLRFRAKYYMGTPAEKALLEPVGPKTDWLEGYRDKTKFMQLEPYARLSQTIYKNIVDEGQKWDYMYDLLNMGYGY